MDFWPNIDYLATKSPTSQNIIVDVDLNNDNIWLIDKATATVFGALGVCGIIPCPGHNAGHFAFGHYDRRRFRKATSTLLKRSPAAASRSSCR